MAIVTTNVNAYISNRMRELGIKKIHFEPIRIEKLLNTTLEIAAYNEFYFLVTKAANMPAGLIIESDTHLFANSDSTNYAAYDMYDVHEFSGMILIDPNANAIACFLEFIRVIPEEKYIPV